MKRLQEETMTKMAVLGRGSMRDKQKVKKVYVDVILFSSSIFHYISSLSIAAYDINDYRIISYLIHTIFSGIKCVK